MSDGVRGPRVRRSPAVATWECDHRWGSQLGDVRFLRVTRTDGGRITVTYGTETVDVGEELVAMLAEMVAEAAAWSDPEAAR